MADWQCARCRARVAPGAPRCPECPSTEFVKTEAEAGDVLKISRDGTVSDSADVGAAGDEPFHVEGGFSGPGGVKVLKVPAEGAAESPAPGAVPAAPEPGPEPEPAPAPVPPRPPRRMPPPAASGD